MTKDGRDSIVLRIAERGEQSVDRTTVISCENDRGVNRLPWSWSPVGRTRWDEEVRDAKNNSRSAQPLLTTDEGVETGV
jgi:hypothetical protein